MDDLVLVRIVQRVGKPCHDFDRDGRRQQPCRGRVFDEVLAAQQFHGDVRGAAVFARIVDRHDVRVRQAAGHLGFPEEARARLLEVLRVEFVGERDRLDRHLAVDARVAAPVDDAHGALAKFMAQFVPAQARRHGRPGRRLAAAAARGVQDHGGFGLTAHTWAEV